MPWFRLDDKMHSHPKTADAGNEAVGLWARCGSYSSDYLTDGFIPSKVVRGFCESAKDAARLTAELVDAGFWVHIGGGVQMHDYLKHNPSRAQVEAEREAERAKKERWRQKQGRGRDGRVTYTVESTDASTVDSPVDSLSCPPGSPTDSHTHTHTQSEETRSPPAHARVIEPGRCDPDRVAEVWRRETKCLVHPSLLEVAGLCEGAAAAQTPPGDPTTYAEQAVAAFARWAESCPPEKRPQLAPHKFVEHFGRIQRIVAGHERPAARAGSSRKAFRDACGHFDTTGEEKL